MNDEEDDEQLTVAMCMELIDSLNKQIFWSNITIVVLLCLIVGILICLP